LRILILEDNPNDVQLIRYSLRGLEYTSLLVATEKAFLDALEERWDIILADYNLPQYNALLALNEPKFTTLRIPMIIVTGFLQEDSMTTLINLGAQGFIVKSDLTLLPQMIQRVTSNGR